MDLKLEWAAEAQQSAAFGLYSSVGGVILNAFPSHQNMFGHCFGGLALPAVVEMGERHLHNDSWLASVAPQPFFAMDR